MSNVYNYLGFECVLLYMVYVNELGISGTCVMPWYNTVCVRLNVKIGI